MKQTFITIPEEVEAIQWLGDNLKEIMEFTNEECTMIEDTRLFTHTDYGPCLTSVNSYIVKKGKHLTVYPEQRFKEQFKTKEEWKKEN